jgi:tRNA A-37 threonylcarbamoyl transferase component Bud32
VANNYIVTTSVNNVEDTVTVTWKDLCAAKFAYDKQFCLRMSDNQVFNSEQVVRVIPRRRMVAFGVWQGKQVVAKLFYDNKNARRHMEKDIAGIQSLQKNKIPTPELLYEGATADKRVYILIFERIFDSRNLEDLWREKRCMDDVLSILKSVVIEIATQHVLGLMQHDLHLKNFLLTDKTIYTLDGAQIESFPNMLSKSVSMNNLALFLSQLGIDAEGYHEILFRHYADARGWSLKPEDTVDLLLMIRKWNDHRWGKFIKKIFRNCTDFVRIRNWQWYGMYNRAYESPEFLDFMANPDSAFSHPSAHLLKAGRSSTVVKVTLGQRDLVVKRYNMKNGWHRLRRCLRSTRALSSWRLAQKLCLFDIPTARPVAFIEKRVLGLRGKSYYVTEYVSGEHAGDFFKHNNMMEDTIMDMVKRISLLLKSVAKLEITHGDLKITNILIDAHKQPVLIDLDGAAEHLSLTGLRKAWRKEIERFLDNFRSNPNVKRKFEAELAKW